MHGVTPPYRVPKSTVSGPGAARYVSRECSDSREEIN
jgi:hypothetical protein